MSSLHIISNLIQKKNSKKDHLLLNSNYSYSFFKYIIEKET